MLWRTDGSGRYCMLQLRITQPWFVCSTVTCAKTTPKSLPIKFGTAFYNSALKHLCDTHLLQYLCFEAPVWTPHSRYTSPFTLACSEALAPLQDFLYEVLCLQGRWRRHRGGFWLQAQQMRGRWC